MKLLIFIGLFVILSQNAFATGQVPDVIRFNGNTHEIFSFPMESYFAKNPNRRPRARYWFSHLQRGYRAHFEIINNELILVRLETMRSDGVRWRRVISWHFGRRFNVSTFSGEISLPNGAFTGEWRGFTPIFESYIVLTVIEGNVTNVSERDTFEQN
ncbi:MAG: hypothetical protein FWG66_13780 [Spirochaetes bacterium]|nr:hypothetical protein [Spirochaetota bacterium]